MGFGFDADGSFRQTPLSGDEAGLLLNDRFDPSPEGLSAARAFLAGYEGLIVCDFERPKTPALSDLVSALPCERLVVPPEYRALPHSHVLAPAYVPKEPFVPWLAGQRARFGPIFLDAGPINWVLALDGSGFLPDKDSSRPAQSQFSQALCCRYTTSLSGGIPVFRFFDTAETLLRRLELAEAPGILLAGQAAELGMC